MNARTGVGLGIGVILGFSTPVVVGQVFKCTAADGKVTYTDVPCLRSEATALVDTRANVADHGTLRKEAARLQSNGASTAPQAEAPAAAPPDPPPRPAAASSSQRSRGY